MVRTGVTLVCPNGLIACLQCVIAYQLLCPAVEMVRLKPYSALLTSMHKLLTFNNRGRSESSGQRVSSNKGQLYRRCGLV